MLSHIIKGADGKSSMITMETLPSDMAKILPTIKIIFYTTTIAFISGYSRVILLGFHPVLQGALLGLVLGTICGKTLYIGGQIPKNPTLLKLIAAAIALVTLPLHYYAVGYAIPTTDVSFLPFSWFLNDLREVPQFLPLLGIGDLQESVNRNLWLAMVLVDAIVLIATLMFALPQAAKAQKRAKKPLASGSVNRMFLLVIAVYASALITQRDELKPNLRKIENWTNEVWSHHFLTNIFEHESALLLPDTDPLKIALEDTIEKSKNMGRDFPEAHYLTAIEQLSKGNFYLARDELGRAILQTEQMTRRTWLEDGTAIHRDMLLAQLYQLRAKLALNKGNNLAAERDLTVAILIHQDFWLDTPISLNQGYFKVETELLTRAGYHPDFGFGACHYERYLARKDIDTKQAQEDLKEAISLEYPVPETDLVLPAADA